MAVDMRLLLAAAIKGPWPKTETLPAKQLWSEKPVVVYAIRRLG